MQAFLTSPSRDTKSRSPRKAIADRAHHVGLIGEGVKHGPDRQNGEPGQEQRGRLRLFTARRLSPRGGRIDGDVILFSPSQSPFELAAEPSLRPVASGSHRRVSQFPFFAKRIPDYAQTSASFRSRYGIGVVRTAAHVRRGMIAARS
jgi:hypothetical protein